MDHIMEVDDDKVQTRDGKTIIGSIEGYVIVVLNIHEEAAEEDVVDFFEEWGRVKSIHLNLDRQSGYVKGYALIEYAKLEEAMDAVQGANGQELLGKIMEVDFAFVETEKQDPEKSDNRLDERDRSRSPERN